MATPATVSLQVLNLGPGIKCTVHDGHFGVLAADAKIIELLPGQTAVTGALNCMPRRSFERFVQLLPADGPVVLGRLPAVFNVEGGCLSLQVIELTPKITLNGKPLGKEGAPALADNDELVFGGVVKFRVSLK